MNESAELFIEEVLLEESAPEFNSLEVACENKLGFTALCAVCPLVSLLGECPKQVLAKADQEFTYEVEQLGVDVYDSEQSFSVTLPLTTELGKNDLATEPVKQISSPSPVADKPAVKPPVKPLDVDKETPEVAEAHVERQRQPSYLELLFDDAVPVVVASVFRRPQTKTVNQEKVENVPDEIIVEPPALPQLHIEPPVKKPEAETPVYKESPPPAPLVVPKRELEQKQTPQPKRLKQPMQPTIAQPSIKKQSIQKKKPTILESEPTPKVVTRPMRSSKETRSVIETPQRPESVLVKPYQPEAIEPTKDEAVALVEAPVQAAPIKVVSEVIIKNSEANTDQDTEQNTELYEAALPSVEPQLQDEITNKILPYFEQQLHEQYEAPVTNISLATPEILTQSTVPLHATILKNIKLLLGSFVLKITL